VFKNSPIFFLFLNPVDGTGRLSRNIGYKLSLPAVEQPRRRKILVLKCDYKNITNVVTAKKI
jgi:hypothetical protein